MLPYTPLHYLLFSDSPEMESEWPALVMTSGNLSEEPIVVSNQEALLQLERSRGLVPAAQPRHRYPRR